MKIVRPSPNAQAPRLTPAAAYGVILDWIRRAGERAGRGSRRTTASARPLIIIGREEHRRLGVLAMAAPGHSASSSDALNHELDRAQIVPDAMLGRDAVRIGSIVSLRSGSGGTERVMVVYPDEADAHIGRVSVLSPLGTALIGLSEGHSIAFTAEDGRRETLSVVSVVPPGPSAAAGRGFA